MSDKILNYSTVSNAKSTKISRIPLRILNKELKKTLIINKV